MTGYSNLHLFRFPQKVFNLYTHKIVTSWTELHAAPAAAPALYLQGSYVFFGCLNTDIIAKLDGKSYKWSKLGKLATTRANFGAIVLSDTVFVVGGQKYINGFGYGYGYGFRSLFISGYYLE